MTEGMPSEGLDRLHKMMRSKDKIKFHRPERWTTSVRAVIPTRLVIIAKAQAEEQGFSLQDYLGEILTSYLEPKIPFTASEVVPQKWPEDEKLVDGDCPPGCTFHETCLLADEAAPPPDRGEPCPRQQSVPVKLTPFGKAFREALESGDGEALEAEDWATSAEEYRLRNDALPRKEN